MLIFSCYCSIVYFQEKNARRDDFKLFRQFYKIKLKFFLVLILFVYCYLNMYNFYIYYSPVFRICVVYFTCNAHRMNYVRASR